MHKQPRKQHDGVARVAAGRVAGLARADWEKLLETAGIAKAVKKTRPEAITKKLAEDTRNELIRTIKIADTPEGLEFVIKNRGTIAGDDFDALLSAAMVSNVWNTRRDAVAYAIKTTKGFSWSVDTTPSEQARMFNGRMNEQVLDSMADALGQDMGAVFSEDALKLEFTPSAARVAMLAVPAFSLFGACIAALDAWLFSITHFSAMGEMVKDMVAIGETGLGMLGAITVAFPLLHAWEMLKTGMSARKAREFLMSNEGE